MPRTNAVSATPGLALKAARLEQGLTLRALAARIGMPLSTLSKLENGKMTMTYDKLVSLAQGLGVDLGSLITPLPVPGSAVPAPLGRRSVSRAGAWAHAQSERYAHYYPAADLLLKAMVPIIIEVKARGLDEIGGLIRHTGEEYLYVLSGRMEVHSDLYAPLPLGPGDSLYFDSGMAHAYINVGDGACEVLCVCMGAGIQPFARSAGQQ